MVSNETRRLDGLLQLEEQPAVTAPGRRTSPGVLYGIGDSIVASSSDDLE